MRLCDCMNEQWHQQEYQRPCNNPMTHSLLSQRRYFFLVLSVVWIGWFAIMLHGQAWTLFRDNWFMTATMCVGSFIAGATSEGGGAVAFPVMTLLFGIEPSVARDFSLMIQSVGMTAASALIFCFGIKVEWRAILFAGIGGTLGIVLGLSLVAPGCEPSFVKMFFTSLWLSFAVALYWINRNRKRSTNYVDFDNAVTVNVCCCLQSA